MKKPDGAVTLNTWDQLHEVCKGFVAGECDLLVIAGTPGLSKSQTLKHVTRGANALYVKGRHSAVEFFCDLYDHQHGPVVIDDADSVMNDNHCKGMLKHLTETDAEKLVKWKTNSHVLNNRETPQQFWTSSPVCVATNSWSDTDDVYQALASRAELFWFEPDWAETYRYVCTWFWDQAIMDYIHERLSILRRPDIRVIMKAWNRKKANWRFMNWRKLIDDYCDDESGLLVRQLLDDRKYKSNAARAKAFEEMGGSRATFYRRKAEIEIYRPKKAVRRIVLKKKSPPKAVRRSPSRGRVPLTAPSCGA